MKFGQLHAAKMSTEKLAKRNSLNFRIGRRRFGCPAVHPPYNQQPTESWDEEASRVEASADRPTSVSLVGSFRGWPAFRVREYRDRRQDVAPEMEGK